jgi:hypothetical protein
MNSEDIFNFNNFNQELNNIDDNSKFANVNNSNGIYNFNEYVGIDDNDIIEHEYIDEGNLGDIDDNNCNSNNISDYEELDEYDTLKEGLEEYFTCFKNSDSDSDDSLILNVQEDMLCDDEPESYKIRQNMDIVKSVSKNIHDSCVPLFDELYTPLFKISNEATYARAFYLIIENIINVYLCSKSYKKEICEYYTYNRIVRVIKNPDIKVVGEQVITDVRFDDRGILELFIEPADIWISFAYLAIMMVDEETVKECKY